jgi:hypothetical protein
MKYEDLSFTTTNKDGLEVICDILEVVPNPVNSEEPYVIYTDYTMDANDEFVRQYGKVIEVEGEYVLKNITDPIQIEVIKKESQDEVVRYVNEQIQENIS